MYRHGPTCLQGPFSRNRRCWKRADGRAPDKRRERPEPLRRELIERVRTEIAAGTYETPEKWREALERLLDRLEWA
jgi:hypothetical protein